MHVGHDARLLAHLAGRDLLGRLAGLHPALRQPGDLLARGRDHEQLVAADDDAAVGGLQLSRHSCAARGDRGPTSRPRPWEITPARSSVARNREADSREEPASIARSAWVAVIGTSTASAPSATAWSTRLAITLATRLWTVWKDWLASRSLVVRSRRDSEAGERDRELRAPQHQPAHVRAEDREHVERVDRLDRGRAALVVEHRQLAEDVARAERRERDLAAVGVLADRSRVAGADEVARVRLVALAEDRPRPRRSAAGGRPRPPARGPTPPAARRPAPGRGARPFPVCSPSLRRCLPLRAASTRSLQSRGFERPLATAPREAAIGVGGQRGEDRDREQDRQGDQQHARDHLEHAAGVPERRRRASSGRPGSRPSRRSCACRGSRARRST